MSLQSSSHLSKFANIYHKLLCLIYAICLALGIYLCFTPIATIGDVSMGNSIYLIKESFKHQYESSMYLSPIFTYFAYLNVFMCSIILILFIHHLLDKRIEINASSAYSKMNLIFLGIFCVITYFIFKPLCAYYSCSVKAPYIIFSLCFGPSFLMQCFTSIYYRRKIKYHKEEKKKTKKSYKLYEKQRRKENKEIRKMYRKGNILVVTCLSLIFIGLGLLLFGMPIVTFITNGPTDILNPHTNCEVDWWFDIENSGYLRVGQKNMYEGDGVHGGHTIIVDRKKGLEIELTDKSREWKEYGDNYSYYKAKIEELKDEIGKATPDKSWEKYLEKLALLEKNIQYLSKEILKIPYNYAVIEFGPLEEKEETTGNHFDLYRYYYGNEILYYTHNRNVNYCDENGKKWGYSDGSLSSIIIGEKINLSETSFSVGTDFTAEKIIASVRYSDGSTKISFVVPTNCEELNSASAGQHTLRWSDEWGDYEAIIIIE